MREGESGVYMRFKISRLVELSNIKLLKVTEGNIIEGKKVSCDCDLRLALLSLTHVSSLLN